MVGIADSIFAIQYLIWIGTAQVRPWCPVLQCCYLISQVMSRSIRSELKQEIAPLSIQASSIRKINTRNQSVSQIMPRYQSHKDETVRCCNLALLLLAAASSKAAKDPSFKNLC